MNDRSQTEFDSDALLEHEGWVRSLARALVGNEHEADEVVQQTWLNALLWPPRRAGDLRGWLSVVVRNVVRTRHRGETRAQRRMQVGARSEAIGGELDAVARLELQRRVADAVMTLPPIDREVIVLRYYDERGPADIAADLELPVATVKSRLARAKDRLRRKLSDDDATGWYTGLALLAFGTTTAPRLTAAGTLGTGGGVMASAKGIFIAAGVVAVALTGALLTDDGENDTTAVQASSAGAAPITSADGSHEGTGGGAKEGLSPWAAREPDTHPAEPPEREPPAPPVMRTGSLASAAHPDPPPDEPPAASVALEPEPTPVASTPNGEPAVPIAGSLVVFTRFVGVPPAPVAIDMSIDPMCTGATDIHVERSDVRVGEPLQTAYGQPPVAPLLEVFVTLEGVPDKRYKAPRDAVVLDQKGCTYEPRVFGIVKKQDIEIVNSDPMLHNIHAIPKDNKEFNIGMPTQGMRVKKTFKKDEAAILITCDVHPWMSAYAYSSSHPYFAVTAGDGRGVIDLSGLPDGEYTLRADQPFLGTTRRTTIRIADGACLPPTLTLSFTGD